MRFIAIFLLLFGSLLSMNAQNWEAMFDTKSQSTRVVFVDTIDHVVYIGGHFRYAVYNNDTIDVRGIVKWDGEHYEQLGIFPNLACNEWNCLAVTSITRYKDEIYASLSNASPDPGEIAGLGKWNGIQWDTVGGGIGGLVFHQIIYNDDLYVMGRFSHVEGNDANSIARWDGEQWHIVDFPYFRPNSSSSITFSGATIYNDDLYVVGNFYDEAETARDVARFDGETWHPVGEPIQGGWDDVADIIVFQDELYICGDFKSGSGNAGNKIMKLVNNSWVDVGGGFDRESDTALKMQVYQNKLYIIGYFFSVGQGVPARNIAIWDGEKWCGTGTTMDDNKFVDFAEFEGALIVLGGFDTLDNERIRKVARWTGGDYLDTCRAIVTNVKEPLDLSNEVNIYPNPTHSSITIEMNNWESINQAQVNIFNILGEQVYTSSDIQNLQKIDVHTFPVGVYWVSITDHSNGKHVAKSFVVKH